MDGVFTKKHIATQCNNINIVEVFDGIIINTVAKTIYIWNFEYKCIQSFRYHVKCICKHPNGNIVCLSYNSLYIYILNPITGQTVCKKHLKNSAKNINVLQDGSIVVQQNDAQIYLLK